MIIPRKYTSNHLTGYHGFQWIELYNDLTATEPWNHG
jgi:hypothetical protein